MTTTPAAAPETSPKPKRTRQKGKPGDALFGWAFAIGLLGAVGLVMSLGARDAYGFALGPSPLAILMLVAAVVLAGFGFGRRVLAALENKGPQS